MHDGRATTLAEAILEHGSYSGDTLSEGSVARAKYLSRTTADKRALLAFLDNLVLFKIAEEESAAAASPSLLGLLQAPSGPRQVVKIAPKGFRIVLQ
jgi:hypothetical protein